MLDLALIQADFRTWEIVAGTGIRKRYDFRTSHCLYRKPGIAVPLEMSVDTKHRNVCFLALSGHCTVTSLTTAYSQELKLGVTARWSSVTKYVLVELLIGGRCGFGKFAPRSLYKLH